MKAEIIACSIGLLNKHGINSTSFRQIALEMNISDGHVRYYFKTKEILLLAIFEKMNAEILNLATSVETSIRENDFKGEIESVFHEKLKHVFTIMSHYSFIFKEAPDTIKKYETFIQFYKKLIEDRKILFVGVFKSLIQVGFFNDSFDEKAQTNTFNTLFILSDSWIRHHYLLSDLPPNEKEIEFYATLTLGILKPYKL
jgi:AcrR family transcriptional regulator